MAVGELIDAQEAMWRAARLTCLPTGPDSPRDSTELPDRRRHSTSLCDERNTP